MYAHFQQKICRFFRLLLPRSLVIMVISVCALGSDNQVSGDCGAGRITRGSFLSCDW